MCIDLELTDEYFNRLKERYTPEELVELLEVSFEEVWDNFYDELLGNEFLLKEMGMIDDED